jgi:hypothetical protein
MPISLRELLSSPICDLPRKRDANVSLCDQLATMNSKFFASLRTTDPADEVCAGALNEIALLEEASEKIVSAVRSYLNGSPFGATTVLREGLEKLRSHLDVLITPRQRLSNLYRVREIDTLANADRKDIFHVPFDFRHRVQTQRYSISGWPSLYLGASLMVCWEEVGRPAFHKLAVACFDPEKSLTILDFGYRPSVIIDLYEPIDDEPSFFTPEYMVSYLICWPLLAACSMSAHHRGSAFVEEYIVPQSLLQWLRDEAFKIDGIRYFSMRVNQTSKAPRLAINYVFPVRTDARGGHCSQLKSRFSFTLPVPWNLLEGVDLRASETLRKNEPYILNPETTIIYDDTMFGKLETQLNTLERGRLL